MPSYGPIADDERQVSLGTNGSALRRRFSKRITRSLGITQFVFGIVCLILAVCFPALPQSVSFNVISPRIGEDKCILSVIMIIVACMLTMNGIVGAMSSLRITSKERLNIANFLLAVPNTILSSCGIMLCSYAVYLDGARFKEGDYRNRNAAWFIAGIQASCYIESITSLFVVLNCWLQMRSNSCVCRCSFMGADCTCGCDNESRTHYESKENDGFNGGHSQHEEEEEQSTLPFHGRDGTYVDMTHENGGSTRSLLHCVSENDRSEEYMDMNHGRRTLQKNEEGTYVDVERKNADCTLQKDRNRTYVNVKHGEGGLRRPSRECVSEGAEGAQNASQQHLEYGIHRPQSDTQLVLSSQFHQINPLQRRSGQANKSSSNHYEDVVDLKKDCT